MTLCKVCLSKGMIPKCPFCGRKAVFKKSKLTKIKEASEKERIRLNEKAYNNFKKTNSEGSGCKSFDTDVRRTHGDWKE